MTLTSRQRAHLRKLAHHLDPVVHVGSDGVTPPVLDSILDAFNSRELLKVKVQQSAPVGVREAADSIAARLENVQTVQTIGRIAVLYRPDPDDPVIELPG